LSAELAGPRVPVRSRPKPRIETLSDLIFGLALSIGTISLIAELPKDPGDMFFDLAQFGFSFAILISIWITYTSIMSVIPLEDRTTVILNVVMLFLVSIEPYLFYLNASDFVYRLPQVLDAASTAYAVDLAGLMAILALFTHQLTLEEKGLVGRELTTTYRRLRNILIASVILFVVTALPSFWTWRIFDTPLRFYFWLAPLALMWVMHVSQHPTQGKTERPSL